ELYLSGENVARGYIDSQQTAQVFLPNPFMPNDPVYGRFYKTGDVVRHLTDGSLHYLGWVDNQVKLRGYRVELDEIESFLMLHSSIQQVAVIFHSERKSLICYVESKDGLNEQTGDEQSIISRIEELKGYLLKKLPEYMVPTEFLFMEK